MSEYKVVWVVDIDAGSPKEAAQQALDIQLDNEQATFFELHQDGVKIAEVDLFEDTVKLFDDPRTEQQRAYLKSDGMNCPHCGKSGSECIDSGSNFTNITEDYKCVHCHKTWTDVYTLSGVEVHD